MVYVTWAFTVMYTYCYFYILITDSTLRQYSQMLYEKAHVTLWRGLWRTKCLIILLKKLILSDLKILCFGHYPLLVLFIYLALCATVQQCTKTVYHYSPLCTMVYHYVPLSTTVYHYALLCPIVCHCILLIPVVIQNDICTISSFCIISTSTKLKRIAMADCLITVIMFFIYIFHFSRVIELFTDYCYQDCVC